MNFIIKITTLFTMLSLNAFADGIPSPMEEQTRFNWICTNGIKLHLFIDSPLDGGNALYINNGSQIRANFTAEVADALITKNYAELSEKTTPPDRSRRTLSFQQKKGLLSVRLEAPIKSDSISALNCKALF